MLCLRDALGADEVRLLLLDRALERVDLEDEDAATAGRDVQRLRRLHGADARRLALLLEDGGGAREERQ
jgi:hypothetical protein